MEFIRSRRVRVMLKGYQLCEDGDDLFSRIMEKVWHEEGESIGNVFELERRAGINSNVLPWQVDGLMELRQSESREFGMAFERLALRGCTAPLDFYYALLGLVGFEEHLAPEPQAASLQIARRCLVNQDYSPLLMAPDIGNREGRKFFGFIDILSWGLGPAIARAHHAISVEGNRASFEAQPTGHILLLETSDLEPYNSDLVHAFTQPLRVVLAKLGADVDRFVKSLALRIFAVNPYAVLRRLHKTGRYQAVQDTLQELKDCGQPWPSFKVRQIIADLGLDTMDLYGDQQPEDKESLPAFWKEKVAVWTPMTEFMMPGRAIHIDACSCLIGMYCPTCRETVVTRAAIWIPHEKAHGAMGYRIPGLHYERSLPGGVGLLVKDENIIGRFIYCVPCCRDTLTHMVELNLPSPPVPSPNGFRYGEGLTFVHESPKWPIVRMDTM
ncbi:hypothetical protein LTR42_012327 [Elasticomyces elasticus]|nr:hypothetical protein LTR42_012327 [Elasticomyces elasticus]